jgi:hypothetical protein
MIQFVCVLFQREKRETQHVRSAANEIYSLSFFSCLFDVNFRALVFFVCVERVIYTFVSRLHTTKMTNEVVGTAVVLPFHHGTTTGQLH